MTTERAGGWLPGDDDLAVGPLTEREILLLRRMMRDKYRWMYIRAVVYIWAKWATSAAVAAYATYKASVETWHSLFR